MNKEKRSKSSDDANNSFVKNVTSKMTSLLPSTITKWFSSTNSSNTNGSAQIADSTDSSTEDEAPESLITTQPPAKRMRFNSPGVSNTYIAPETKCTSTNTESIGTFSEVQSPISRNVFRSEQNFVSSHLHSSSEDSSPTGIKKDSSSSIYNLESAASSDNTSVLKKRKSLFDLNHEDNYVRNTDVNPKEPHFNPSLYASPFYNRKTKYGGASSSYINQPNIKHRKNTTVTNYSNNDNITISHAARRVLDLLENYSSPLMEAKRISQFMKSTNNSADDRINKKFSYKTQELHVPSIATILRLKQKSRLMDTTSAARQIIASHSSSSDFMPYPESKSQSKVPEEVSEKLTTKIKSRLTRTNRDDRTVFENNSPINLPTAVLQIDKDNLPKFSLGELASKSLPTSTIKTTDTLTSTLSTPVLTSNCETNINEINVKAVEKTNNKYQFSNPVTVSNELVKSSTPKFAFGSPEQSIEKAKQTIKVNDLQTVPEKTGSLSENENWKCDDCWVSNKSDVQQCVCCGGKKPTKGKTNAPICSKCEVVSNQGCKCNDFENKNNNIGLAKLSKLSQWKCQDCWVFNSLEIQNCVCCGSKKPTEQPEVAIPKPKTVESSWTCEECLIKNKGSNGTCTACGTSKPVSKDCDTDINKSISQSKTNSDSLLKNIVTTQTNKWECPSCLVRNENNISKCVCCESEKPGTTKESEKKSFNFGVNSSSFKFGIDPKLNISEKKIETSNNKLSAELEKNNNISPKTFTFGLPAKKSDDKFTKGEEKDNEHPLYTFGIPKQISSEINAKKDLSKPVFGILQMPEESTKVSPQTSTKTNSDDQQDAAKIEQPKLIFPETVPTANIFTTPQLSFSKTSEITIPKVNNDSVNILEKNEPLNNPVVIPTINSSAEIVLPKSTFTFSSSGIKPATNLFAPPATTTVTTTTPGNAFTTLQGPPVSSATLSFFQKSNPVVTSPLSFFQTNESTPSTLSLFKSTEAENHSSTTTQSDVSSAPVFSFGGSNIQNVGAQPEKPKFNFTFGSNNKSDPPATFKAMFGATADSNVGTNNFSLTTANSMNTGNVLSGNTLGNLPVTNTITGSLLSGSNNGLPTANPLAGLSPGNALGTGSNLSGNGLSGNSLPGNMNLAQTTMQAGSPFGAPMKKDNMWSPPNNTSNNLFVSNASVQKPSFTFSNSVSFNTNNTNPTPTFGNPTPPTQNLFGISNQTNQPSLFSNPIQNSTTTNIFGAAQPTNNPSQSVGMFGTPNVGVTPTFGSANPIQTFEAPSMNATPAPAFNFGAQQPSGIFGFGQQQQTPQHQQQQQQQPQQQQQQPQQTHASGVYNFGATPAGMGPSQVQFNMGSSPYISGRRVRKAIRRTTQR